MLPSLAKTRPQRPPGAPSQRRNSSRQSIARPRRRASTPAIRAALLTRVAPQAGYIAILKHRLLPLPNRARWPDAASMLPEPPLLPFFGAQNFPPVSVARKSLLARSAQRQR